MEKPGLDASLQVGPHDRVLQVFGETIVIRRDPGKIALDISIIEEIVPPGVGGPFHRHSREDEISYVIDGVFRIWRGDEIFDAGPGSVVLLPREQVHTFQNIGTAPARLLTAITPKGLEAFFEAIVDRAIGDEDAAALETLAAEYGVEIVAPPPETP
jgi:mannose-6-phosphate isomerase-like protein (cupin superfamily)